MLSPSPVILSVAKNLVVHAQDKLREELHFFPFYCIYLTISLEKSLQPSLFQREAFNYRSSKSQSWNPLFLKRGARGDF
jgi:hypothetical protein